MARRLLLVLAAVSLLSCGKEVGRVPFAAEGTDSTTTTLVAGDVAFWTDIDLAYDGTASLHYEIELSQGGAPVATALCDPLGHMTVKESWVETNLGASHTRRGRGKMNCSATLAAGGATTVKATLAYAHRPVAVTLRKADLVVRQ
jgi:hypothetical protein